MSSKILRYLFGFFILFLILAAIALSNTALMVVSAVFIVFTINEYRKMFKTKDIEVIKIIPEMVGIILAYLFIYDYQHWVTPTLVSGIFLTCFYTIITNKKPYIPVLFSTIMSFIFIFCTLYIVKIFYFMKPSDAQIYSVENLRIVLTYIFAVMAGDFTASKAGPHFKKYLLSPEISPNKTIVGSIANLIASCLVCCSLYPVYSIYKLLILGTVISIFSQIGDLTVSMLKRDLGIKHSGDLFLDYGGILDRVDAFIFSAPASYYCLLFLTYFI